MSNKSKKLTSLRRLVTDRELHKNSMKVAQIQRLQMVFMVDLIDIEIYIKNLQISHMSLNRMIARHK